MTTTPPSIGLALGSGAARGWAHIGILRELEERGLRPSIICGTSMGALIGAAYCLGKLDVLEGWCRSLTRARILQYLDIKGLRASGLLQGNRVMRFFHDTLGDADIRALGHRFGCIATDIETGNEVWLTEGSTLGAVRASIGIPGIFTPYAHNNRWLVDGELVNPVPVTLCRALEADIVIAVDANGGLQKKPPKPAPPPSLARRAFSATGLNKLTSLIPDHPNPAPGLSDVLINSLNIVQGRITRSRLAGDPPDVLLSPRLNNIGLLEFDRAPEAIEEGRACVRRAQAYIEDTVSQRTGA